MKHYHGFQERENHWQSVPTVIEASWDVLVQHGWMHQLPISRKNAPKQGNYKLREGTVTTVVILIAVGLTMLMGNAAVVKRKSHDRKNQYFALLQGMMSVKKARKKYTN
jgi:uncharacterized membrane protein YhaH (DUF805 family)